MHPHLTAAVAAARYEELRSEAAFRQAHAGPSRFTRGRSAWRARRAAPTPIGRPRAA